MYIYSSCAIFWSWVFLHCSRLEEVKGRLSQLQDLVQYYQTDNVGSNSIDEKASDIFNDLSLAGNLRYEY